MAESSRRMRRPSHAVLSLLALLLVAFVAGSPASDCRQLLDRSDMIADEEFRKMNCDAIMYADEGTAQMIVDNLRPPPRPAPPDAAEPCRTLLRRMDESNRQFEAEFEQLDCAQKMLDVDPGIAQVLVETDE